MTKKITEIIFPERKAGVRNMQCLNDYDEIILFPLNENDLLVFNKIGQLIAIASENFKQVFYFTDKHLIEKYFVDYKKKETHYKGIVLSTWDHKYIFGEDF